MSGGRAPPGNSPVRRSLLGVVVVGIAAAVALRLHQLGRRVEDVLGRHQRAGLLGGALGRAKGDVGGVRFGRGGDVDHGLGDGELALGRAQKVVGVLGGVGDHQRLRIGQADVLDRHAHDAAREIKRVLAGIEHAGEIIQRGVGIGAAHRLVQRRDQIVVAVLLLVVDRRAPLHDLLQRRPRRRFRPGARRARFPRPASARRGRRHRPCGRATAARRRRAAASCPRAPRRGRAASRSPRRRAT